MTQAERDAQAAAQREAERQARINDVTARLNVAMTNKNDYERYARGADNATLAIAHAAGGAQFINGEQKDWVSEKLDAAIHPQASLMELLCFENTNIETTLTTAEADVTELAKSLWKKYEVYEAEVARLTAELQSI